MQADGMHPRVEAENTMDGELVALDDTPGAPLGACRMSFVSPDGIHKDRHSVSCWFAVAGLRRVVKRVKAPRS